MVKIIRASDAHRVRWKNGGGWTREIASGRLTGDSESPGADWHWRLSVADIEQDGPFSIFPGIDRVLVLIDGAGMRLRFAEEETVAVTPDHPRIDFAGEGVLGCTLIDGPTRDFNLMWRRDMCNASLAIARLADIGNALRESAEVIAMFLLSGALDVDGHRIVAGDTLLWLANDSVRPMRAVVDDGQALLIRVGPKAID